MKLFQRLLVAPAALGLMAPMAVDASEQLNNVTDRVDSIEESIDGFEAGVFSNQQTKLSGNTTFIIGGVDAINGSGGDRKFTEDWEAVSFNYDAIVDLDSSFSGDDLLRIRLRAGNFFPLNPTAGDKRNFQDWGNEAQLERSFWSNDRVVVNRAYYQFPIGNDFTATLGAMVRQDDMLGVWPSDYPSDSILDVLTYAGANSAYPLENGPGFGLSYLSPNGRWSVTALSQHLSAMSSASDSALWRGGIGTEDGFDSATGQLAYLGDRWRIALARHTRDGGADWDSEVEGQYNAWGLSGVYQVDQGRTDDTTLIPSSISAGMGWSEVSNEDDSNDIEDSRTYSIGIVWNDALSEGNSFGIAWGTAEDQINDSGYDDPHAWEVYYAMGINDNITVTPAFFQVQQDDADDVNGVVLKTTFTF